MQNEQIQIPSGVQADLIEDGKYIHSVMSYDRIEVRERIPLVIHKWSPERAEEHLADVAKRLRHKLLKQLMIREGVAPAPKSIRDPARLRRLESARESQVLILVQRLAKMHGVAWKDLHAVGVSWSEKYKALRSWIAAGKPEWSEVG